MSETRILTVTVTDIPDDTYLVLHGICDIVREALVSKGMTVTNIRNSPDV